MDALLIDVVDAVTAKNSLRQWCCIAQEPGSITHPDQLGSSRGDWLPAVVPGTVAAALNCAGRWDFNRPPDLDASDWWFRTIFTRPDRAGELPIRLCFDGLATLGEIWLNGRQLLTTDNMFRSYCVDISDHIESDNELVLGFRSLSAHLNRKRPRPRWKTNLVRNQQLRWLRTSFIGRMPGWSPCAPAIGPWRDVRLESAQVLLDGLSVKPSVAGTTGVVSVQGRVISASEPHRALLRVGAVESPLELNATAEGWTIAGRLEIPNVPLWWPHSHGTPSLFDCSIAIVAGGETFHFPCSRLGFRKLEVRTDDEFAIVVNDEPVFCRGACWTVSDLLLPSTDTATLRGDLQLAKDAGANMLRVGGTMHYESDPFYQLCDELGLLVWQDFMFANLDYPVDDRSFRENITIEAIEQLNRLSRHPSVVIYCGNSEIEQQAAMLGLPRERWTNDWFSDQLPELCRVHHPGTAYVPSTPTGGALPFHTHTGISHYYGVGAYLRSASDLRQADVKFTPECLGFANIPEPATAYAVSGGSHLVMHDPVWKQRVPRDAGAGWDFEDVRDHYLRETFGVDAAQLRSFNMPRYLELSRVVSGELMAKAFSEWRGTRSRNMGALVWFYKDLWPGAGWGVLDSFGIPKAPYYFLKRSWHARQLAISDEGLNGIDLHLTNETSESCAGAIEVMLLKEPNVVVARHETPIQIGARAKQRLAVDAILGRFCDVTHAYRFGPPQHDVVIATWFDDAKKVVGEAFHFIRRLASGAVPAQAVAASAVRFCGDAYQLTLSCDRFLDTVRLEADGFLPDDNYFHLVPHRPKTVAFREIAETQSPFRAVIQALNLDSEASIALTPQNSATTHKSTA